MKNLALIFLALLVWASQDYAAHLERTNAALQADLDDMQNVMGCMDTPTTDQLLTKAEP